MRLAPAPMLFFALALLLPAPPASAADSALSADGRWRAELVAPDRLAITAADTGALARVFEGVARDGTPSRFEGVYVDPTRRHFIVPLLDAPEYWLIATDPDAPPVYEGFVHSREAGMVEGLPSSRGLFARERVPVEHILTRPRFSDDFREMYALTPDGRLLVTVNLYVDREIGLEPVE